jgi:hypothetical protein
MRTVVYSLLGTLLLLPATTALGQPVIGTPLEATTFSAGRVLESLTAGGTVVNRADLSSGSLNTSTTVDESGNFLGTYNGTGLPGLSSFDMDLILAKNDAAGSTGAGPSDPSDPANPIDVVNFGADVGVISGNWRGTNGPAADFFVFEVSPASANPSNGDLIDVQAILPGGVLGNVVFLPQVVSGEWFDTGTAIQGGPNSGQIVRALAINVQDLFDQNGANLPANAELEGLRFLTPGGDLALVAATKVADPLQLDVNTTTGELRITNPNATSFTLGTNFYRITSSTGALRNDTWNSLDDQETSDGPGQGWVEGGGSFNSASPEGDYSGNGFVDGADFLLWQQQNGSSGAGLSADGTGDDMVDAADLNLWAQNLGATGAAGVTNQLLELRNDGIAEIAPGQSLTLGNGFSTTGDQNLVFTYGTREGLLVTGTVNYASSASAAIAAVPEPATATLGLSLLALLGWRRHRRRPTGVLACHSTNVPSSRSIPNMSRRIAAILALMLGSHTALAQVTIYDGDEVINLLPSGNTIDSTYINDNLGTLFPTSGAGAWVTGSTVSLSNETGLGAAGSAPGVDGAYLTFNPATFNGNGAAASYIVRDAGATTGVRSLNFSMYYNDLTPNPPGAGIPAEANDGGNVAVRVYGINENGVDPEPWDGTFGLTAGAGRSGAEIAGRYTTSATDGDSLVRDNVEGQPGPVGGGSWGSRDGDEAASFSDVIWRDVSIFFDAGTGYDWLVFSFSGGAQSEAASPDPFIPADRFAFDNIVVDIGSNPRPGLTVDRTTGQVTINNLFDEAFQVTGYSISSPSGSLDTTGWTPIDGRLDATSNGGNGSFDADSAWSVTSSTSAALAESADAGDGGTLAIGGTVGLGAALQRSPFTDLVASFMLADGRTVEGVVSYTGTGPLDGDFDDNGVINALDFDILAAGSFTDLSGLSDLEAYRAGDLNGDGDNDFGDFQEFRELFIAANGAVAFANLLAGVPEPTAGLLSLISVAGLAARRRRR